MTLEEKVAMLHAQSKFSSPGVPRLGIPEFWTTDGPHGVRPEVMWDEWDQAGWTNDSIIAYPALRHYLQHGIKKCHGTTVKHW
jgi:beta-glucosidase